MHTRRGHYAPCCVNGHILMITRVTHPLVTFHKKIQTLLVLVGVGGITHEPQQRALGHKTIHAFGLNNFSRMVIMKKFLYRLRASLDMALYKTSTPRKTLQAFGDI